MLLWLGASTAGLGALIFTIPKATSADPVAVLLNYGALGIFLVCILTGLVRTKSELENRDKQLEAKDRQIADLQRIVDAFTANLTGQTLPALARSTQVLEQLPRGESAIFAKLERLADVLEGMKIDGDSNGPKGT